MLETYLLVTLAGIIFVLAQRQPCDSHSLTIALFVTVLTWPISIPVILCANLFRRR